MDKFYHEAKQYSDLPGWTQYWALIPELPDFAFGFRYLDGICYFTVYDKQELDTGNPIEKYSFSCEGINNHDEYGIYQETIESVLFEFLRSHQRNDKSIHIYHCGFERLAVYPEDVLQALRVFDSRKIVEYRIYESACEVDFEGGRIKYELYNNGVPCTVTVHDLWDEEEYSFSCWNMTYSHLGSIFRRVYENKILHYNVPLGSVD
ncbi:MAG: hypothetical protein HXK00_00040 [Abiotrophia defectiva]|uniref:Uncharacterized protein n=1 Tax=Abiotrophia defectiva TaxID=46125 RepID=A0A929MMR3_ABIDE|nr:hypothetical protein [Abiotrophia defectiva]